MKLLTFLLLKLVCRKSLSAYCYINIFWSISCSLSIMPFPLGVARFLKIFLQMRLKKDRPKLILVILHFVARELGVCVYLCSMCGRYVKVSKVEVIEKRFKVMAKETQRDLFTPDYNIGPGKLAAIITQEEPGVLQLAKFGLTPFWAKKQIYLFNARAEGDNNKENDPNYTGGLGIISKPAFREPIRNKRCLIIADCFYEGPEKEGLSKPYVVYVKDRRPFAFAGIYDKWVDKATGEEIIGFSIITTMANELMQKIGHHRSPVILPASGEQSWLSSKSSLSQATLYLHPYPTNQMNAYPVGTAIKNPRNNGKELLEPIGQRIYPESIVTVSETIKLQGMGHKKKNDPGQAKWGETI